LNFDKYISDLLLQNDCVIVPDFGGFVANYTSAKIHPAKHTFTPPSKNVVFNKNLKNNDGLLAYHITTAEKINYSDACKNINNYVNSWNKKLKGGEKIEIKNVGSLYLDVEQNIQFNPDKSFNYLLDSFGLTTFQSPPIKRESVHKKTQPRFIDRKPLPAERKKASIKRYIVTAIIAPLLFAILWIPLKTDLIKNINYSSLNPFNKGSSGVSEKNNVAEPISKEAKVSDAERIEKSSAITINKSPKIPSIQTEQQPIPVSAELLADEDKNKKYHIIGGCFAVRENAEKLTNKLKQNGYNASIIDHFNSLYRVRYNSYANRGEAIEALAKIRSNNPEAWLLVK